MQLFCLMDPEQWGKSEMAQQTTKRGIKLLYFLKKLEKAELETFSHFLLSPLFANSPQLADLLSHVLKQIDREYLLLEPLHNTLFPETPWTEKRSKYLLLRLYHLLEQLMEFISFQAYQKDKETAFRYRMQDFVDKGWETYIDPLYKQANRGTKTVENGSNFLGKYKLEVIYNDYASKSSSTGTDTHLEELHRSLDHYYFLEKLKYGTAALNVSIITGQPQPTGMIQKVLQETAEQEELPVIIQAYFLAYKMLEGIYPDMESGEPFFHRLLALLKQSEKPFDQSGIHLCTYMINFCILQIKKESPEYIGHLAATYDLLFERGYGFENGQISKTNFKNIVAMMCQLGNVDQTAIGWVEEFIETNKGRVAGDPDGLVGIYNQAVVQFYQGNYQAVVSTLYHRINEFDDPQFGIGARIYVCRALWAREEFDWLEQALDAFRHYLKRKQQILAADERLYHKFVLILGKIVKAITGNPDLKDSKLKKIGKSLETAGDKAAFPWLRSIIREHVGSI